MRVVSLMMGLLALVGMNSSEKVLILGFKFVFVNILKYFDGTLLSYR
jgi:hypothetical protein